MKTKGRSIKTKQDLAIAEELQKAGVAPYLLTVNTNEEESEDKKDAANENQVGRIKYRFMINNSREAFS